MVLHSDKERLKLSTPVSHKRTVPTLSTVTKVKKCMHQKYENGNNDIVRLMGHCKTVFTYGFPNPSFEVSEQATI